MIIREVYDNFDAARKVQLYEVASNIPFKQFINGQIAANRLSLSQLSYESPEQLQLKYQELQNEIKLWTDLLEFLNTVAEELT